MKHLYKIVLLLILFVSFFNSNAQYGNNWYFFTKNAVKFDAFPPSVLTDCKMYEPNIATTNLTDCATTSDVNGNLLFYNNGDSAWGRNHIKMPNGFDLCTPLSTGHVSFAIPFISDTSRYYIFQSAKINTTSPINFYTHHVVNMNLNGGFGDLEKKNDTIYTGSSDRLTAIKKANGVDYWLITHTQIGNTWKVFTINCLPFNKSNFIVSNVGTALTSADYLVEEGLLKVSSDGKYLATNFSDRGFTELYKFDNTTGTVNNPIKIKGLFPQTRSFEFSPNNKFIYIFSDEIFSPNTSLAQYDISIYDSAAISNSQYPVLQNPPSFPTGIQLQLSIDGRIYFPSAFYNSSNTSLVNTLSVIANPNVYGAGCNFTPNIVTLSGTGYVNALPYTVPSISISPNVQATYTVAADCRTVTFTGKTYIKGNNLTFKWKWGEPSPIGGTLADSATQVITSQGDTTFTTITHIYPPGIDTFFASLTVTSDTVCGTGRAGVKVIVKPPKPKANFGFSNTCNNLNVVFTDSSLLNFNPSLTYTYAYKSALAPASAYINFSTLANNNFTFATYDSFDIRLVVKSAASCGTTDTIVKRIVLKAKPTAGFSYTNTCGSLQANITSTANIAAGSISTQQYYLGNTLINTGINFNYTFANYGTYIIKHVTKSNFGCVSDTAFVPVIVKAKPTLNLTTPRDSVCANTNYTIIVNAAVAVSTITNYTWIRNNTILPITTNQLTDNQTTNNYSYKVITTANNGCKSDTAFKTITVASKPIINNFTATNTCGSKAINITSAANVINDNITNYYVSYGDGITSSTNPSNTNYTYANFGTYILKYVVKGSVGCSSDTAYFTIIVKDKPTLNLTTLKDSVCANTNFTITVNAAVNNSTIANYTWLKNNVLLANTNIQLTDNQSTNIYTYKVIATAANGCKSDTAFKTITVASKPLINNFAATNTCGSKAINITATSNVVNDNIANYYVSYGDGITSSTSPNGTTYTYANFGTYNLKYVVKGSVGCSSDTAYFTINVKDKPTVNITYNNNACNNKNFTLTANSSVNASTILNYTWLKNNVLLANTNNQLTDNQSTNIYTYKVIATATNGCKSDTASQIVTVQNFNSTLFTATSGCVNQPIVITNTSINNNPTSSITYTWTTSDAQTSTAQTPTFSFATNGTKTIQLKTNTTNNCADSLSKTITIDDFPVADFSITEACLGKKLNIANNSTGSIASYNWSTSNGQIDNNILPNFIFNTVGSYSIKLEVATANDCKNSITKSTSIQAVQITTKPVVDTNIVVNQNVKLFVTGASTYSWQWASSSGQIGLLQNANSNAPTFVGSTIGIYPIMVEGTTAQGCKGTANIKINVFAANNYVWIPNTFTPNADGLNDRIKITCTGLQSLTNFTIYNRYGEKLYEQTSCTNPGWDGTYKQKLQPQGVYVYVWAGTNFKGENVNGKGSVMLLQ